MRADHRVGAGGGQPGGHGALVGARATLALDAPVQVDDHDVGPLPGRPHGRDQPVVVRGGDAGRVSPAVQAASVWSRIWLAASSATRRPRTVT